MSNLLAVQGLACERGGRLLFEGLSLTLEAGGAAVVTGPNGVGKSSLIRVIAGLLRPFAGTVRAAPLALLGEGHALDEERPLARALRFWAALDGEAGAGGERVAGALAALGLAPLAEVPVRLLSTGQRRRAAIARVAATGAPLWLLDEPANGLDDASVGRVETLIAGHRAGGGAVLVATHLPLRIDGAERIAIGASA